MSQAHALGLSRKFQEAILLLTIHELMSDQERDKMQERLDTWAQENGLRRKAKP